MSGFKKFFSKFTKTQRLQDSGSSSVVPEQSRDDNLSSLSEQLQYNSKPKGRLLDNSILFAKILKEVSESSSVLGPLKAVSGVAIHVLEAMRVKQTKAKLGHNAYKNLFREHGKIRKIGLHLFKRWIVIFAFSRVTTIAWEKMKRTMAKYQSTKR